MLYSFEGGKDQNDWLLTIRAWNLLQVTDFLFQINYQMRRMLSLWWGYLIQINAKKFMGNLAILSDYFFLVAWLYVQIVSEL